MAVNAWRTTGVKYGVATGKQQVHPGKGGAPVRGALIQHEKDEGDPWFETSCKN